MQTGAIFAKNNMYNRNTLRVTIRTAFFILLCAALPLFVSAHGDEASWEVPAGNVIADVGYDPEVFTAGTSARFDFNLKTTDTAGTAVPFDEVWVRIKAKDDTYLATGLRKESFGPTTLVFLFATPGEYALYASFRNANGDEIAAATFPITVGADSGGTNGLYLYVLLAAAGVAIGVVCTILFSMVRKLRKS